MLLLVKALRVAMGRKERCQALSCVCAGALLRMGWVGVEAACTLYRVLEHVTGAS